MDRFGDYFLLVLALLVAGSPFFWLAGVPLGKVAAVTSYWLVLWLLAAGVGRKYGR
jgi:hypothetical protein